MIKQLAAQHLQKVVLFYVFNFTFIEASFFILYFHQDTTNHFADIQFEQRLRDNEEVMSDYLKMFVRGNFI